MTDFLHTLNDRQLEAVKQVEGPVLIMAGAGSGKTKALTCRIAYMLSLGIRPSEQLRVVSMLSVGAKERVMVIEVGKEQLLIGVTAGGITALHTLPEPLVVAPAPALPNFAELLAKRLRKES